VRPALVLVGPPGAGKTTVGRAVASELGVNFRDTDADIAAVAGKSIPEVFVDEGEEHFRALERAAVAEALTSSEGVLALGGGAVLAPETRDALAGHTVVFLSVGLGEAARRVGLARDRPVLALNPRGQLRILLEQRRPHYEAVATATVDTDGRDVAYVVAEVLGLLARETATPGGSAPEVARDTATPGGSAP